jgi:hypothetical protein
MWFDAVACPTDERRYQWSRQVGSTARAIAEATQRLTGREIERAYIDKGYRGHDAPNPRRVFISGQKRGVFGAIKREIRRHSAIEPVIRHMKAEAISTAATSRATPRCGKRHPLGRRLQLQAHPRLVEGPFAPNPGTSDRRVRNQPATQSGFLTDD